MLKDKDIREPLFDFLESEYGKGGCDNGYHRRPCWH